MKKKCNYVFYEKKIFKGMMKDIKERKSRFDKEKICRNTLIFLKYDIFSKLLLC